MSHAPVSSACAWGSDDITRSNSNTFTPPNVLAQTNAYTGLEPRLSILELRTPEPTPVLTNVCSQAAVNLETDSPLDGTMGTSFVPCTTDVVHIMDGVSPRNATERTVGTAAVHMTDEAYSNGNMRATSDDILALALSNNQIFALSNPPDLS